ncbi:immunoglobulin lambda-1 light chain-like isoform X2 [Protopterus annectens]|uniref:immunoglobulin lambda-1 light chain-like isoform X2 n=1 Tax=Protopterus annectens TaxID=7888 RepID=UPI001CFA547A|nr:immunoglobulin lambda-1 light chain-like isoform X2 [Protopterus annectens]
MLENALILVFCLPALETRLIQFPSVLKVNVGESAQLMCTIHDDAPFCFTIVWHIQKPGALLKMLEVNNRFNFSKNEAETNCFLTIHNIQKSDAGIYFCARCSYALSYFGSGTKLIVKDRSVYNITPFVFPPSTEEINLKKASTLLCLVYGVSHGEIAIYWNISGILMDGLIDMGPSMSEGMYAVKNQLTVPAETWNSGVICTCTVEAGNMTFFRSISRGHSQDSNFHLELTPLCFIGVNAFLLLSIISVIIYYQRRLRKG